MGKAVGLRHFAFVLLAFQCGRLLEGKRIAKGVAKERLTESLHQELYT
jgi:hypothetical protein